MAMLNGQCDNICVVCCLQFTKRKNRKRRKSDCDELFYIQRLHESLADIEGDVNGDSLSLELSKYYQSVICPNCISCVTSTLLKKDLLNGLEEKVRKLQLEILKLLNRIQNEVKDFSKELDMLETIVEDSRENVNRLDEFYLMKMEHDQKEEEDAEGLASTKLKDAISFRERILSVFDGLCSFNKEVNEFNGRSSSAFNQHQSGDQRDASVSTSISQNQRSNNSAVIRDEGKTLPISRNKMPKVEGQKQDTNEDQDLKETSQHLKDDEEEPLPSFRHCDNSDMNPSSPPNDLMDHSSREVSNAEEDGGDDDYDPRPSSNSRKRITRERAKRKTNLKSIPPDDQKGSPSAGDNSNDGEDFDGDFRPGQKAKKKPRFYKEHVKRDKHIECILSTYDFSGMTTYKKNIITRIIIKTEKLKYEKTEGEIPSETSSKQKRTAFDDMDPTRIHLITYDQTTDTLNLCDFQVTINEQNESVECRNCGASSKANIKYIHDVQQFMYNHILGFHLKLFTCPHCQRILKRYLHFKTHVLGHLNMFVCDICGKPLKGPNILKLHKYQHMNQEERKAAAAKERDGKDPIEKIAQYSRKLNLEKKHQCSICGKGFKTAGQLQQHEEIHQNKREHMCPNCGKAFNIRSHLHHHLKYTCFPGNGEVSRESVCRFQCDQCPKKFPVQSQMRTHKLRMHTELEYKFKCDVCDKRFKLNENLYAHKKVHLDVRPYVCKNGCGASFKTSNHCKRHEKTCKHVDGNVGYKYIDPNVNI